jgi:phosphatidate phosphatase APP1
MMTLKGFSMTLSKENSDHYFIIRDTITRYLSITNHRLNIASESEITKVKITKESLNEARNKLEIVYTKNIITHYLGVNAYYLYLLLFLL